MFLFNYDYQTYKKLVIPDVNKMEIVELSDIVYIDYDDDITIIHLINDKQIYTTQTLKDLKESLRQYGFYQIDKGCIINIRYVTEINSKNKNCFIKLNNIEKKVSRRKQKEMKELFNSALL